MHIADNHATEAGFGPRCVTVMNLNPPLHFKVISVTYHSTVLNQYFTAECMKDQEFLQLKRFPVTTKRYLERYVQIEEK